MTGFGIVSAILNMMFTAGDPEEAMSLMPGEEPDMDTMIDLLICSTCTTCPDGAAGRVVLTFPAGNYSVTISYTNEMEQSVTAAWNGTRWPRRESDSGSMTSITVESGCETWITNAGLYEVPPIHVKQLICFKIRKGLHGMTGSPLFIF